MGAVPTYDALPGSAPATDAEYELLAVGSAVGAAGVPLYDLAPRDGDYAAVAPDSTVQPYDTSDAGSAHNTARRGKKIKVRPAWR